MPTAQSPAVSKTDLMRQMYGEMTSDIRKKMIAKLMKQTGATEASATTIYSNVRFEVSKTIVDGRKKPA